MALTTAQLQLVEQRVANDGPQPVVAYLLWFFIGGIGAHRFYLGRVGSAIVQIVLLVSFVGWLILIPWWLIDAFLIPGMAQQKREELRQRLISEFMVQTGGDASASSTAAPAGFSGGVHDAVPPPPSNPQIVS